MDDTNTGVCVRADLFTEVGSDVVTTTEDGPESAETGTTDTLAFASAGAGDFPIPTTIGDGPGHEVCVGSEEKLAVRSQVATP